MTSVEWQKESMDAGRMEKTHECRGSGVEGKPFPPDTRHLTLDPRFTLDALRIRVY